MITAYTGAPGSGKSLDMARRIEQAIRYGKNVICNSEIMLPPKLQKRRDKLFCVDNDEITPEFLRAFAKERHKEDRESQTLVVIDECQLKFGDTFMTKNTAKPWGRFFSQHRKLGYDVLMVTPSLRTGLIRDIRVIVEIETVHWKMTNYPTKSIFLGVILLIIQLLPINLFMSVMQWRAMPEKKFLIRRLFLYKPKYGKMYDTFKIYDMDEMKEQLPLADPTPEEWPPQLMKLLEAPDGLTWERGGGDTACGGDPPRAHVESDSAG